MSELEQTHASVTDAKMLALADRRSPEEISEEIGGWYKPKEVAARIQALLKSRNWLTMAQEDQLVTIKMRELLGRLEERFEDIDNMKLQLRVLKEIGARLDKRQAATSMDLDRLYDNQGKIMAHAFALALEHMKQVFGQVIVAEEWDEAAREGLVFAAAELDKHQAVE